MRIVVLEEGEFDDTSRTRGFQTARREYPGIRALTVTPADFDSQNAPSSLANNIPLVKQYQGVPAQDDGEIAGAIQVFDARISKASLLGGSTAWHRTSSTSNKASNSLSGVTNPASAYGYLGVAVFDALKGVRRPAASRMIYQEAGNGSTRLCPR
jgi:hypothetical protein